MPKQYERTYMVTWRVTGTTAVKVDRQLHTPRYHTTFASVLKLISTKTGVDVDDIEVISAVLLEAKEMEEI